MDDDVEDEEEDPLATALAPPLVVGALVEEVDPPPATGCRVNLIVVGDVADKLLCNVVLCDLCDADADADAADADADAADDDADDVAPPLEDDEEEVVELVACLAFSAVAWLPPPEECAADFSMSASKSSSSSGIPPIFHSSSYSKFVSFDSLELEELLDEDSDEVELLWQEVLLPLPVNFVFVCFLIALELLLLLLL